MSNVTLSVVVPSVDIIFDDDTAAVVTAVDADTVLGVTPGAIGLQVLAATTGGGVLDIIGGVSVTTATSIVQQATASHERALNPHGGRFPQRDEVQMIAQGEAARQVAALARTATQYPTADQAILAAQFFGA